MTPPIDPVTDADALRVQLLAPDAMARTRALHALETALDHALPALRPALKREVEQFAERGIPYYAPEGADYRRWVDRAVAYWQRLHAAPAAA